MFSQSGKYDLRHGICESHFTFDALHCSQALFFNGLTTGAMMIFPSSFTAGINEENPSPKGDAAELGGEDMLPCSGPGIATEIMFCWEIGIGT